MKPWLEVGYVARAHGIRGEVIVRTHDPASEALFEVERVRLRPRTGPEREVAIEAIREHSGELLVGFEGVASREASEALVGAVVAVARDELEAPAAGEFFQGDLVGLEVFDPEGRRIGQVREVWSSGPVPNLVIDAASGELMVPFAEEFVPEVDLARGRLTLIVPELAE